MHRKQIAPRRYPDAPNIGPEPVQPHDTIQIGSFIYLVDRVTPTSAGDRIVMRRRYRNGRTAQTEIFKRHLDSHLM